MDLFEEFEEKKTPGPNSQYNKWNNLVILYIVIIALENNLLINVVIMIIVVELDECRVIHIDCYEQFVKLLLDECRAIPIDCYKQFLKMLNKQNSSWGMTYELCQLWLVMMQMVFYKAAHPSEMPCMM